MRSLRLPREISELVILVYRYTFLVLEQSERMFVAARCRLGNRGLKNSLKTFSRIAVGMFTRSIDAAERSQTALYCRDFRGDFPSYRQPAPLTAAWALLAVLSYLGLFLADRFISSGVLL